MASSFHLLGQFETTLASISPPTPEALRASEVDLATLGDTGPMSVSKTHISDSTNFTTSLSPRQSNLHQAPTNPILREVKYTVVGNWKYGQQVPFSDEMRNLENWLKER